MILTDKEFEEFKEWVASNLSYTDTNIVYNYYAVDLYQTESKQMYQDLDYLDNEYGDNLQGNNDQQLTCNLCDVVLQKDWISDLDIIETIYPHYLIHKEEEK